MNIKTHQPQHALNDAFKKVKPARKEIERFKINLALLLERTNDSESEEFHKNLVIDFLKETYYRPDHYINTKGRNDLVIHEGQDSRSPVGVIVETKKPTNSAGMVSAANVNNKAFHELLLYYLRERITQKNLEVKYLIATNFDRLMEQALEFEGIQPEVISSVDGLEGAAPLVHRKCRIVKLHGDYRDARILNTPQELSNYPDELNSFLDRVFDEFGLIVCGWSGAWDFALRKAILRCPNRRFATYWLSRGKPTDEAEKIIKHRPWPKTRLVVDAFKRPRVRRHFPDSGALKRAHYKPFTTFSAGLIEERKTPVSDYLYDTLLSPIIKNYLPDQYSYENAFDLFEYLLGLVYIDLVEKPSDIQDWAPDGTYGYRDRFIGCDWENSPILEFIKEGEEQQDNWAPLQAGLFGGDYERFCEVHRKLQEIEESYTDDILGKATQEYRTERATSLLREALSGHSERLTSFI